jgi:7-keto-8-aminopelargonate synthetase-like enzyme
MIHDSQFRLQLDQLRRDGNYRVFANLERRAGAFPQAILHAQAERRDITVWCSNDYLGMGQHPVVLDAMHAALDAAAPAPVARATSPAPIATTSRSRASLPTCTTRKRHCCLRRAM